MTLVGMQTDMQCSYFPRYQTTDLNLNATCNVWPLNNVERLLHSGHGYNADQTPPALVEHLPCKEVLKKTMLQQEAEFKSQILELHRVYNKQRELMDAMKRNESYRHHHWLKTSKSRPSLTPNSLDNSQKTCQVSSLPWMNPACGQSSVSVAEHNSWHLSFCGPKTTQVCDAAQTKDNIEESELLESKCKKVGKKMLDLELPAEEYIDIEEEESLVGIPCMHEAASCRVSDNVQKGEGEASLGSSNVQKGEGEASLGSGNEQKGEGEASLGSGDVNSALQENNMNQASFSGRIKVLADLNEPIKPEEEDHESNDFLCPVSVLEGMPCMNISGKSDSNFQVELEDVIPRKDDDHEAGLNILCPSKSESQQDCLSGDCETGKSSSHLGSFTKVISMESSSCSEDAENTRAQEISSSYILDQCGRKLKRKREVTDSDNFENDISSCLNTSSELVPRADALNYESSLLSSRRRHTHNFVRAPIVVQALPCFSSSTPFKRRYKSRGHRTTTHKSHHGENAAPNSKFHCPNVQSSGKKCASKENGAEKLIKGAADVKFARDFDLNSMSPCSSLDVDAGNIFITEKEKESLSLPDGTASALHLKKVEACDGRPNVSNDGCSSPKYSSDDGDSGDSEEEKNEELDINLDHYSGPDLEQQLPGKELAVRNRYDKKSSDFGFCIDLNSCIDENDSPSSAEVYLEAPVSPENKESSPPRGGESDENQPEVPFQQSGQDAGHLSEEQETFAAEALVSISSSQDPAFVEDDDAIVKPFEELQFDSLHWFSGIVSSLVDDPENELGVVFSCEDHDNEDAYLSDSVDSFEAMTLSLKETEEEEYCCTTYVLEPEASYPSSLSSQPRKGRTRSCRQQRKDFQSEILPSLASLSRYEVTEDLLSIGGGVTETTRMRRNAGARKAGRNECQWLRRRRPAVHSTVENAMCLKQQTTSSDLVSQMRSLASWATITKRRTGKRCRAGNPKFIVGQA